MVTPASYKAHIILGPTASGKSEAALHLAKHANGTVICADAIQLFKGLPLLMAQPSKNDDSLAPHQLYGHFEQNAPSCSAALFRKLALQAIQEARQKGMTPLLVGGTGFYIKSLLHGLSDIPSVPDALMQQLMRDETSALYACLHEKDPASAKRLNPFDRQRVMRALSVILATGKPLSYWQQKKRAQPETTITFHTTVINPPPDVLKARIEKRCDLMFAQGLMDEVAHFRDHFLQRLPHPTSPAFIQDKHARQMKTSAIRSLLETQLGYNPKWPAATRALGFYELLLALEDAISLSAAKALVLQRTLQYAKRQRTWIRHQVTADHAFDSVDAFKQHHLT
ncbi:MAG: tRNA (adenosine(37)-N6)-dimethylallyltransferase MiaA [Holosporaceae bacterium]